MTMRCALTGQGTIRRNVKKAESVYTAAHPAEQNGILNAGEGAFDAKTFDGISSGNGDVGGCWIGAAGSECGSL
jgi:hypothetical protein